MKLKALNFLFLALATNVVIADVSLNVNSSRVSNSVSKDKEKNYYFNVQNNWTYVVYLSVNSGDADLYGKYENDDTEINSIKSGIKDDFFRFKSSSNGKYKVNVYGYEKSDYSIYIVGFPTKSEALKGKLVHPLSNNPSYTYSQQGGDYGLFGSPWGNPYEEFLFGTKYAHHVAVDLNASGGTNVKASHSGKVYLGSASTDVKTWGYYVQVEGNLGGEIITTTYMHLQKTGRPKDGSWIEKGKLLGKVYDVSGVKGEKSHLHFAIYQGSRASHTREGSLKYDQFPKKYINPQDSTLYQSNNSNYSVVEEYMDLCISNWPTYFGTKIGNSYACGDDFICQNTTGKISKIKVNPIFTGINFQYYWGNSWGILSHSCKAYS